MAIPLTMAPKILYRLAVQEPGGLQTGKGRRPRDHFFVTEPDPATQNYRVTPEATAALTKYLTTLEYTDPEKPKAVPIRVMGNPVMEEGEWTLPPFILRCELAYKLARGTVCHCTDLRVKSPEEARADNLTPPLDGSRMAYLIGEAEQMRFQEDAAGRPILKGKTRTVCNPARCPFFQESDPGKARCKPDMNFVFQVPWLSRYGPWVAFKSTSYRSYQGIRSTLRTIAHATNGWLFDLPLWLCTRIERTGNFHNAVCWVEYRVDANGEFEPEADELHAMLQAEASTARERWMSGDNRMKELTETQEVLRLREPEPHEVQADLREFHPEVVRLEQAPTPMDRKHRLEEEARVLYQVLHGQVSEAEWKAQTQALESLAAWEKWVADLQSKADAEEPEPITEPAQEEPPAQAPGPQLPPDESGKARKGDLRTQASSTSLKPAKAFFDYQPGDPLDSLPSPAKFAQKVLRSLGADVLSEICQTVLGKDRPGEADPDQMAALIAEANRVHTAIKGAGDA